MGKVKFFIFTSSGNKRARNWSVLCRPEMEFRWSAIVLQIMGRRLVSTIHWTFRVVVQSDILPQIPGSPDPRILRVAVD